MNKIILLLSALTLNACGTQTEASSSTKDVVKQAPQFWSCQTYSESKDRKHITNFTIFIKDGDGDGEYTLDVGLYQRVNGRQLFDNAKLYEWERDGVKLYHLGNNIFTSAKRTINFKVTYEVGSEGFGGYKGVFSSKKWGIKNWPIACNWNGEE